MPPPRPAGSRLVAVDWLRTLTIAYVVLFHAAQAATRDDPSALVRGLAPPVLLATGLWRMPLMFLIAGLSTELLLQRQSVGAFLAARVRRLVVPATFTFLTVVPLLRYADVYAHEVPHVFAAHAWSSLVDGGEPRWYHLWFVVYLAMITAAAVAGRLAFGGAGVRRRAPHADRGPGRALVALVALALLAQAVPTRALAPLRLVPGVDPRELCAYGLFFGAGVAFARADGWWGALVGRRRRLGGAAVAFGVAAGVFAAAHRAGVPLLPPVVVAGRSATIDEWALRLFTCAGAWTGALAVLGYGARHLRRPTPALEYLRDASYVVYLLHQVILAWCARAAAPIAGPAAVRWALLACTTGLVTLAVYEFGIRRNAFGRLVFGLPDRVTPQPRPAAAPAPVRLPAGVLTPASVRRNAALARKVA